MESRYVGEVEHLTFLVIKSYIDPFDEQDLIFCILLTLILHPIHFYTLDSVSSQE